MTRVGFKARLAAAGALALVLAACDDRGGGIDAPEPMALAELSAPDGLPYAEPATVAYEEPSQGYAWAERAYGLQRAVYDTPPDYGFYYDDLEPLVWETDDDWTMYAEPWDDGYRYYYYEPGADYPYFVRDAQYGYGYGAGGVLVAVFDAAGRYLSADMVYRVAPTAGRYYARGHGLRSAGKRAKHVEIADQLWVQRAPQVIRTADPWLRAARDDRGWRAWRERDQDRELRRFEPEAQRRAARTREWRERDDRREAAVVRAVDNRDRHDARREQAVERQRAEADRRWGRENARQAQQVAQRERRAQADQAQRQAAAQDQRRQAEQRRGEQQQQRQAEARRQQADQQRAAHEQRRQQAEQAERGRQQQARQEGERRQAQAQQQAEQQRRQAERQQAQQQHAQQAQAQPERGRGRERPQQQAQARSAEQQGQPAAERTDGGGKGKGQGQGKPHGRKD